MRRRGTAGAGVRGDRWVGDGGVVTAAGEVVTRTDIWEHVYDFNSTAESNVVDVFIGHLRRKIERQDLPKLIHTRRGEGYLLAAEPGDAPRAAAGGCGHGGYLPAERLFLDYLRVRQDGDRLHDTRRRLLIWV